MITVRYFARLKEIAGKEEEQLSLSHSTVQELITWAIQTYDGFASEMKSSLVAVNEEYASPDTPLNAGDVIAFIPPVSGG